MSSVGIEKLKISNFRSYKSLELIFDSIPTVIYGKNGVGKTNLLEAISLLYPGKGVRRSSFHDMINFSNNFFTWQDVCRGIFNTIFNIHNCKFKKMEKIYY